MPSMVIMPVPMAKLRFFQTRRSTMGCGVESFAQMKCDQADDANRQERADQVRGEPVGLLAFIQNNLQRGDPDGEEGESPIIDARAFFGRGRRGDLR